MNDTIPPSSAASAPVVSAASAAPTRLTLLSVPPELQNQKQINGEVIKIEGRQVTMKTAEGAVTFETDAALQIGQKVVLKLQNAAAQITLQNMAQILIVNDRGEAKAAPVRATVPPVSPPLLPENAVSVSQLAQAVGDEAALQPQQALPSRLVLLAQNLSTKGNEILLKQLLNLSPQQPLPPPLLEALSKIQELNATLKPAQIAQNISTASQNIVAAADEPAFVEQILGLMRSTDTPSPSPQSTARQTQPQLVQMPPNATPQLLISLPPGTPLTADAVQQILQGLQPSPIQSASTQSTPTQSVQAQLQKPLLMLMVMPQISQQSATEAGMMQAPMIQTSPSSSSSTAPMTALLTMPDGQQGIGFVSMPQASLKSVLPGTVLVMALPHAQAEHVAQAQPLVPAPSAPLTMPSTPAQPLHPAIGTQWEALQQLWRDVQTGGAWPLPDHMAVLGGDMMGLLRQSLPNAAQPQQFTPAVLLFMALMKNNFTVPWAGAGLSPEILAALPSEKAALLSQLSRDMSAIQNALNDPNIGENWRPIPMPLQMGDQLVRMQWFVRHHYDDQPTGGRDEPEQDTRKRRKTRFLLDVPQTKVGDIQIDGLVQPKQLDVILRTESELNVHQRAAIGQRFQGALDINGFAGGLSFQTGTQNYVRV